MNLSNMFPASGGLAAQIKKPVATAVAKPTDNKAVGSSLADCMQTRKRPGEWAIKWPKLRKQGFKDYRPLLTIQEVIDYCNRCEETGLGGFDYETSGDKDHRIPPTDEDGNTVTGKALDSWTRDVNLDPWKAEVCAMSLSAACDEARAIFIDNPGANQFEPGLSRSEARKRLFDTLEQYFFTNHKIVKIAVNMNFETKFTAKYGKYILMPCADPFIAWIRLSQLLLPNKIKNPKRPYVGKGLKPMTKEVFGVQMSEFTSVLERNKALFFDQVPNDEHDAFVKGRKPVPSMIWINGLPYTVQQGIFKELQDEDLGGRVTYDTLYIQIMEDLKPDIKSYVVVHEITHAVLFEANAGNYDSKETFVEALAWQLLYFLQDNDLSILKPEGE